MNTPPRADIVDLLVSYMENRCSPSELKQVQLILSKGGYEKEWTEALARAEAKENEVEPEIPEAVKKQLYQRISHTIDHRKANTFFLNRYKWAWMSAAAVILFIAGIWMFSPGNENKHLQLSATVTAMKQQKLVTLTDGTKIWLNSSSKISYPSLFNGESRDVYLEGEAFFDVVHNPQQPFRVHLSGLTVQVYGTSFNIRSYGNDQDIAVAVKTGKVGVTATDQQAGQGQMLLPGDLLTYSKQQKIYEKRSIGIADVNAWNSGWMIFQEEALENVCHRLERTYGVVIHFENTSLAGKRITLKQQHESLENILEIIRLTSGIRYRQSGNEIWIR